MGANIAAGFTADFSNTTGPAQVSDGLHTATIEKTAPGVSSNGNLKIDVQWIVKESEDEANVGRKVYDVLTFTEAAFFRIAQLVTACELDTSSLEGRTVDSRYVKEVADLLLGESICIQTKQRSSGGVNPATGQPYAPRATITAYHPYGFSSEVERTLQEDADDPFEGK